MIFSDPWQIGPEILCITGVFFKQSTSGPWCTLAVWIQRERRKRERKYKVSGTAEENYTPIYRENKITEEARQTETARTLT